MVVGEIPQLLPISNDSTLAEDSERDVHVEHAVVNGRLRELHVALNLPMSAQQLRLYDIVLQHIEMLRDVVHSLHPVRPSAPSVIRMCGLTRCPGTSRGRWCRWGPK